MQHIEVIQKIVYVNIETGFSVAMLHYPTFPDFKDLNVYGLDLDVICLTETWLNESIMDHEILPTAYNIYRCDRIGRIGVGVMTAVKSTLSSTLHGVPSEFSSLEMVVVEVSNLKYDRIVLLIKLLSSSGQLSTIYSTIHWLSKILGFWSLLLCYRSSLVIVVVILTSLA